MPQFASILRCLPIQEFIRSSPTMTEKSSAATYGPLMRWRVGKRLNIVQQMTLMTIGLYNEPQGAYLPSIIY
jgi:hypothetical protein